VWVCGVRRAGLRHLVPGGAARVLPVVVGGLARYDSSPVGPYDELLAAVAVLDGPMLRGHVPFMAVDSARSRAGGRRFWSLPKELAHFAGGAVSGSGWGVRVSARSWGPAVPVRLPLPLLQVRDDGAPLRVTARVSGRARLTVVAVAPDDGGPLPAPLRAGRFVGLRVHGRLDVPAAR
jgi:hypothetical protein